MSGVVEIGRTKQTQSTALVEKTKKEDEKIELLWIAQGDGRLAGGGKKREKQALLLMLVEGIMSLESTESACPCIGRAAAACTPRYDLQVESANVRPRARTVLAGVPL